VSFFVWGFFFILFIACIYPLSVVAGPVALVWLLAGAPAVCAEAAPDRPITAAQTDVSMVFRREVSCWNNPRQIATPPPDGFHFFC
jgi:hypothetical protein